MLFETVCFGLGAAGLASTFVKIPKSLDKKMQEVFEGCNLYANIDGKKVKPKLLHRNKTSYGVHLVYKMPPGGCLDDFQNHAAEICEYINAQKIQFDYKKHLHMDICFQEMPKKVPWSKEILQGMTQPLIVPLGVNYKGEFEYFDLRKGPHFLFSGPTGMGKSTFFHVLLSSLQYAYTPDQVQLYLVDLKEVEFVDYEGSEHVEYMAYEMEEVSDMLDLLEEEYEVRKKAIKKAGVRKIEQVKQHFPYIVVCGDEWADLAPEEEKNKDVKKFKQVIEQRVLRLARKARFVGIHLILATQRPTVNVITGNLKTNMPARLSFYYPSGNDSQTILDSNAATELDAIPGRAIFQHGVKEIEIQIPEITEKDIFKPKTRKKVKKKPKKEAIEEIAPGHVAI